MNFFVFTKKILERLNVTNFPAGLGGCRNHGNNFDCCEYNVTVFDNINEKDSIIDVNGNLVKLHHGSLTETRAEVLIQYDNMQVLQDEQWDLHMFLSKIKEKKIQISNSYIKSCLIESAICTTKTKDGIKNDDPFASSWLKCGAYFLTDAISVINSKRPSPVHMLDIIRKFEKNKINETFSVVNDCIGIERATVSLLSRMIKSTMGFSDMVEGNNHSKIIQKKHDYLVENSLIADCYFYLCYINRNNFFKIKNEIHRKPELIHVLKVAFDVENNIPKIELQAKILHKTANDLLTLSSHQS